MGKQTPETRAENGLEARAPTIASENVKF